MKLFYHFSAAEAALLIGLAVEAALDTALDLRDMNHLDNRRPDALAEFHEWCRIIAELHNGAPDAEKPAPFHIDSFEPAPARSVDPARDGAEGGYDPRCIHGVPMPTISRAGQYCAACDRNTADIARMDVAPTAFLCNCGAADKPHYMHHQDCPKAGAAPAAPASGDPYTATVTPTDY